MLLARRIADSDNTHECTCLGVNIWATTRCPSYINDLSIRESEGTTQLAKWYCTRNSGHSGDHVACGKVGNHKIMIDYTHEIMIWIDAKIEGDDNDK